MYSYFAFHRLKATTTLQLNRSDCDRSRIPARFKVAVDFRSHAQPSKSQEPTIEAKRYGSEKWKVNMRCPTCHVIIESRAAWKSSTNRFYCSEFCADSEISARPEHCAQKEVHDRLERLRRLLPLFQDLKSNRISPRPVGVLQ